MPPKPKFSREEIVSAALEIVTQRGPSALTARALGAQLGSSARPIFTVFSSMEELRQEVRTAAMARFDSFAQIHGAEVPAFKQVGMQMIHFAMEEPKLYQLLFMSELSGARSFEQVFRELGDTAQLCIQVICRDYGLTEAEARGVFEHVWIHTFGIGALWATGMCRFPMERIQEMLSQDFAATLAQVKAAR